VSEDRNWTAAWRGYFHEQSQAAVDALADAYPAERSLSVDLLDLYDYDEPLAEALFTAPDDQLRRAERVLTDLRPQLDRVHVRVANHPGLVGVADLGARHLGELASVEGVIGDDTRQRTRLHTAVYGCDACEASTRRRLRGLSRSPPQACPACEAVGTLRLDRGSSIFVDVQLVSLQSIDASESVAVPVHVDDDLAGTLTPNRRVIVTGVVRPEQQERSNCFVPYLSGIAVETAATRRTPTTDDLDAVIDTYWTTDTS
jgi:DNA replicative helicase MCM subunit Mcm2 (Cdc46/Mcm family)